MFEDLKYKALKTPAISSSWLAKNAQLYLLDHIDHADSQFVSYYKTLEQK